MTRHNICGLYEQSVVEYAARRATSADRKRVKRLPRAQTQSFAGGFESLESRSLLSAALSYFTLDGVSTVENGTTVVSVLPNTTVSLQAGIDSVSDPYNGFQLNFSQSDSNIALLGWTTYAPAWSTASDSSLDGDKTVAASNSTNHTEEATLGTLTVQAPAAPGDYRITVNDATVFTGTLYYTLYINRIEEVIEAQTYTIASVPGIHIDVDSVGAPDADGVYSSTQVEGQDYPNIRSVTYSYNSVTGELTLGAVTPVAQTLGADGLLLTPDGSSLVVGGQANELYLVPINGDPISTATLPAGTESFHLALDPSGTKVWTSNQPDNSIAEVPLSSFGTGIVTHTVTGSDQITQLMFAPTLTAEGHFAYYTDSNRDGGVGGDGGFGIINLDTFVATRKFTDLAAHSITLDPYTGDIFIFGDHTVTQIDISDPLNPVVKSTLDVSADLDAIGPAPLKVTGTATVPIVGSVPVTNFTTSEPLNVIDQGSVDGFGHAYIAINSGHILMLDYEGNSASTTLVANASIYHDPNTTKIPFIEKFVDDFAPIADAASNSVSHLTADVTNLAFTQPGDIIIRVLAPASISGTVFNDANGNGVQDGGEDGIDGINAYIDGNNNGTFDGNETGVATSGGAYTLNNLLPGSYTIRLSYIGNPAITVPLGGSYSVTLAEGQVVTGKDFGLFTAPTGSISGVLFQDRNGDGDKDAEDDSIAFESQQVFIDANTNGTLDDGEVSLLTGDGGTYSFTGLAAGTYSIVAIAPNGYTQSLPVGGVGYSVNLDESATVTGRNFGFFTTGIISGFVHNDTNGNTTQDEGESAQSGVVIYLDTNNNGTRNDLEPNTTTGGDGSYSFSGLVPGTYHVREETPSGFTRNYPSEGVHSVVMTSGSLVPFQNFSNQPNPEPTGSISGRAFNDLNSNGIFDNNDVFRVGVPVFLDTNNNGTNDDGEILLTTDENGQYTFDNLVAGDYIVRHLSPENTTQTGPQYSIVLNGASQSPPVTTDGYGFGSADLSADGTLLFIEYLFADLSSVVTLTHIHRGGVGVNGAVAYDLGALFTLPTPIPSPVSGTIAISGADVTNLNAGGLYVNVHTVDNGGGEVRGQINVDSAFRVHLGSGVNVVDRDFGDHTDPGSISGTVFTDTNGNGVINDGESGRSGVTVYIDANTNGIREGSEAIATTIGSGAFTLPNLVAGTYTIRQDLPAGTVQTFPASNAALTVVLGDAQNSIGNNFADFTLGSITGTVFDDLDADGTKDVGETGSENATVYIDANSNGKLDDEETTSITGSDGVYSFTGLTVGTYRVREDVETGHTQTTPGNGFFDFPIAASGDAFVNHNFGDHTVVIPHGPNLNGTLDSPGNVIVGDKATVTLHIHNTGDQAATGNISVDLYDTPDGNILDLTPIRTITVDLGSLAAGSSMDADFTGIAVTSDMPTGSHTLVAVIDADAALAEIDENDNNAASVPFNVSWQFGLPPGHDKSLRLTVPDNDGTLITFSMKGPGFGTVVLDADTNLFSLDVDGTTTASGVAITFAKSSTPGDDGIAALGDVSIFHNLGKFDAKTVDLHGDFDGDFAVTSLSLKNVADHHSINIGPAESGGPIATTISLGRVTDTSFISESPIKALTVIDWADNDSERDIFEAPSIDKLSVKGDAANNVKGNFEADLTLGGNPVAGKSALGSASILGNTAGSWFIFGNTGAISAGAFMPGWSMDVSGNVSGITTKLGALSGEVSANSIKSVNVKTDMEDTFFTLHQGISGSLTGLGSLKVGGSIINSSIVAEGSLGSISAKSLSGSHILAGFDGDIAGLPEDADFADITATIKSVSVTGLANAAAASFINSLIAGGTLTKVSLKVVDDTNGGDPFGVVAATLIKSVTRTGAAAVANKNTPGTYDQFGDYVVSVV